MLTYETIKKLCKDNGVTVTGLEKELGISRGSLCKINTNKPSMEKVQKIADFFSVSVEYLMGTEEKEAQPTLSNIYPIELKRFPLLGEIACGIPKYTNEDRESYVMAGTDIKADFCLRASGDSMVNARILDGDIVFVRKQDMVENGEIAAVVVNNESEATLKRVFYYKEQSLLILRAENPAYEEQRYTNEQLNEVHILGKAVAFQSDVK